MRLPALGVFLEDDRHQDGAKDEGDGRRQKQHSHLVQTLRRIEPRKQQFPHVLHDHGNDFLITS